MSEPRIVILGAGFAALTAVRELRKRAPRARITLVAPKAEFVYLPSLIWIPSGLRSGADLTLPLDRFLRDHQVESSPAGSPACAMAAAPWLPTRAK